MTKTYLGDGVYAAIDRFGTVMLTTEDGISTTNAIVLEPDTYDALERVVMAWRKTR